MPNTADAVLDHPAKGVVLRLLHCSTMFTPFPFSHCPFQEEVTMQTACLTLPSWGSNIYINYLELHIDLPCLLICHHVLYICIEIWILFYALGDNPIPSIWYLTFFLNYALWISFISIQHYVKDACRAKTRNSELMCTFLIRRLLMAKHLV